MATINLPDDVRTLVWRVIRDKIRTDATLVEAIGTWLQWDDSNYDGTDLNTLTPPVLRIYPLCGLMTWNDEANQSGPLYVMVDAFTRGLDVEDVLNLQGAIEAALYPRDTSELLLFQQALVDAGAETGLIVFDHPMGQVKPPKHDEGGFLPVGRFSIVVSKPLL